MEIPQVINGAYRCLNAAQIALNLGHDEEAKSSLTEIGALIEKELGDATAEQADTSPEQTQTEETQTGGSHPAEKAAR